MAFLKVYETDLAWQIHYQLHSQLKSGIEDQLYWHVSSQISFSLRGEFGGLNP